MSKITNPITEASVTCGFFNSLGDRKYDATQMSSIFNGIIRDGIFASIGDCFVVKADSGNVVNVGTGKAWFNNTWTQNDAILSIQCEPADVLFTRIDAIVIEVNDTQSVRDNFIKVVTGAPSSNPVKPALTNTDYINQHALCYITRPAGSESITGSNIENMVGTDETPFVTGILETMSIDQLMGQWRSDLDEFVASEKEDVDKFMTIQESDFDTWYVGMKTLMEDVINELDTWADDLKGTLASDPATYLLMEMSTDEIERYLVSGLNDGTTVISEDGSVITTTDTAGRALIKTFTNNFMTCTSVLEDPDGHELGRLVKEFSSDGLTITSEMTILYDPGVVIATLDNGDNIAY